MKTHYSVLQKILAAALALVLVLGLMPVLSSSVTAVSTDSKLNIVSGSKVADDPTLNEWTKYFGPDKLDTEFAGAVWSDKSVFSSANSNLLPGITLSDPDNFLVALSAIAANSVITGHTTVPTDTMLVLDLSGSMLNDQEYGPFEDGDYVDGVDISNVQAMVDATNAAIETLMTQNPNNRVGVVLYSGNTSTNQAATASSATVILPLGSYKGVPVGTGSDAHLEYLSIDCTTRTRNIYEWVRSGRYGGRWEETDETVTYVTGNVDVSVKNGLTTSVGAAVADLYKRVSGGTYIQNGLYRALEEFRKVSDTVVPEGNAQAGVQRMPVIVLMSDGAPTIATTNYTNVGNSNTGNGGSTTDRITFLTQLTAAYVKGAVANHYKENEGDDQDVLFLTLGLGTSENAAATATLYPVGSTTPLTTYWNNYLTGADGEDVTVITGYNALTLARSGLVEAMNYVDKYFYASNAEALISSFEKIVSEIQIQAKHYNTLVEGDSADFSGHLSFEEELGELMEVSGIKGILLGNTLFTGEEFSKGLNEGALGSPSNPTERGNDFIRTVRERIPGMTTTQAQQLIDHAYNDQQIYHADESWSNYLGWYADADGNYVGFWDKDYGYRNAPANAVYANRSYLYLGVNGDSDMMHVVVQVRTNLKTLHQTVLFKIPAALIPMVSYHITLETDDPTSVTEFVRNGADPMRLVFELGPRSDLNAVNLENKIAEHIANGGHVHKNSDGSYAFYTNSWSVGNDRNGNGIPDPEEVDSAVVTEAHFHPAKENGRFYYTEDDLILDASGNPVTGAKPTGEGYFHTLHIYSASGATAKRIPVSATTLAKAQQNDAGQWYIPEGTPYLEYTRFRSLKGGDANADGIADRNLTGTLDYYFYPAAFADDSGSDVYMFLGNNGTITVTPATGITLTKRVSGVIDGVSSYTFTVALSNIPNGSVAAPIITDANGDPIASITSTDYENGSFQVTMPADVTAYITGIPAGTTVTVTEVISGDYHISGISVDGVAQPISNPFSVTVPAASADYLDVTFTNAPNGYGDLVISKDVDHPFATAPGALATKEFFFQVVLSGGKISVGDTFATSAGTDVKVGENGVVTFADGTAISLFDEESITIYDLPEGTAYTVSEPEGTIPQGFYLESVNGSAVKQVSGTIETDSTDTAAFVNRYLDDYTPISVPVELTINKVLEGTLPQPEDFTFVLEGLVPGTEDHPVIKTYIINSAAANQSVTDALALSFDTPGTYHFRIVEVIPANPTPGMTYSTTNALFVVEVTDTDMNGVLEAVVRAEANLEVTPGNDSYAVSMTFTNTYEVHSTNIPVNVHKELSNNTGVEISRTMFQFGLFATDAEGNAVGDPVQVVTTNALGDATFNILVTEDKDQLYIIKELMPLGVDNSYTLNGMTYDPSAYKLTVTVDADQDGQLSAQTSIVLVGSEDAGEAEVIFRNTYALKSAAASFELGKTLVGRTAKENELFQFYLVRTDAAFQNNLTGGDAWNATYTLAPNVFGTVKLNYTKAGTYHYKLTEIVPASPAGGLTYDASEYHITITVSDNGDGTLVASAPVIHKVGQAAPVTEARFTNTYTVTGSGSVVIDGTKIMDGRALYTGGFRFELYKADANGNPVGSPIDVAENLPDGTFVFDALYFDTGDLGEGNTTAVYNYCVKEFIPAEATNNKLNGVTYDTAVHVVTVTVSHDGNGNLTVTPSANHSDSIVIRNTYTADSVTATIHGNKVLGGDWSAVANKTFTFELYEANENFEITNPTPVTTTVTGSGSFSFSKTYTDGQEGSHYYILREDTSAQAGGVSYDASLYRVTVNVTDPGNGKLTATVSMYHPGTGNIAGTTPVATFHNTYSVTPTQLVLEGSKILTGRDMTAGEFHFLVLEGDKLVSEGRNGAAADGTAVNITFQPIIYTAPGVHTYTIVENNAGAGGVTYDSDTFTATVTITDNGDGTLSTSVSYSKAVNFENSYDFNAVPVVLEGTKTLTGRDMDEGEFRFQILENGTEVSSGYNAAAKDGESASITFDAINYTKPGVYTYTVVEVAGRNPGMTYDSTVFTVTVTVTDNGDGTLSTSVNYGEAVNFNNSYEADPVTLPLTATKVYDKSLKDTRFNFTLIGAIGDSNISQEKQNDDNGLITFDPLVFTAPGTYTFQVKEEKNILWGFISWDETIYTVTVVVTDNKQGELLIDRVTYTPSKGSNTELIFSNQYTFIDNDDTLELSGSKTITGDRTQVKDQEFRFGLYNTAGELVEEVKNDANGKFTFSAITFTSADIGKDISYTVKEILPVDASGAAVKTYKGITYDETVYTVDVTVSDDQVGNVVVTYTINQSGTTVIAFENRYDITGSVDIPLEGTKIFTDGQLDANDFTFGLYDSTGKLLSSVKNDANGKFALSVTGLTKENQGKNTYTVKEILPEGIAGNVHEGITYDQTVYTVEITVSDNGEGGLSAETVISGSGSISFNNVYQITGTGAFQVEGTKTLTGRDAIDGEFTFGLYDPTGKLVDDATNAGGKFTLGVSGLGKDQLGTHTYTVKEILPVDSQGNVLDVHKGVTYDKTVYSLAVTVADNGVGGVDVSYDLIDAEAIAFSNSYKAAGTGVSMQIDKTVITDANVELDPSGFSFQLKDAQGTVIETIQSDAHGKATFTELTYDTLGTHTYTISEIKGYAAGITYDTTVHTVTVTVTDDGNGQLVAALTLNDAAAEEVVAPFVNTYDPPATPDTGDNFNLVLCVVVLVVSAICIVALIIAKKKKSSAK